MSRDSTTAFAASVQVVRKAELTHRAMVLALLATVIVVDQLTKWWAWRHDSTVHINYGGNAFVGATVGRWYANPLSGALLDLLDFALLSIAVAILLRRHRPVLVLATGALMVGGWISNLLDRLGMHYLTAPGSVRGAVDFIHLGRVYYNVADIFIVCGTLLFLLTVTGWALGRSGTTGSGAPARHHRPRARMWTSAIAAAVCVTVVVGFSAINYGGVTVPSTPDTAVR